MEKEKVANEKVKKEQCESERNGKSPLLETKEEEQSEQGSRGDEGQRTQIRRKKRGQEQWKGPQKRKKSDKSQGHPMVLMEGDLNAIGNKIRDTMMEVLQQFEQQYMQTLGSFQKDLRELQIQANKIQVGADQASMTQVSLAPGTIQAMELVRTLDL